MRSLFNVRLMLQLLALLVVGITPTVNADVLTPGSTIPGPSIVAATFAGATLLAANNLTVTTAAFSGTARVAVVRNAGGTLDFFYQFSNTGGNGSANDSNNRLAAYNYTGFSTNVFQISNGSALAGLGATGFVNGTISSINVDRDVGGQTVGWNYTTATTASLLVAGTTSLTFEIRTTATNFVPGNFAISDGVVGNSPGWQPAAIPEPSSMLLLGTGLIGVAGAFRRRFKAQLRH